MRSQLTPSADKKSMKVSNGSSPQVQGIQPPLPTQPFRSSPNVRSAQGAPSPSHGSHYHSVSGRPTSYPTFMSFYDTSKLHLEWIGKGFKDALRFDRVLKLVIEDAEIRAHASKSILLNILSLLSVAVFDYFIDPLLDPKHESFVHRHFGLIYQGFWLAPIVGASLYLNTTWCAIIANRAIALRHGRKTAGPSSYNGMLTQIASSAYRVILIFSYLALTFMLSYIPVIGNILSFIYICWVNSYYCFEYLWISRGLTLSQRVRHEEERWGYYLAFGFPSAIVCMWGSTLANAAIFALVFPSFIITAINATPVPIHPYSPTQTSSEPVYDQGYTSIDLPSPFLPIRLPIFAPVIKMNDLIVRLLTGGIGANRKRKASLSRPKTTGDGEIVGAEEGGSYNYPRDDWTGRHGFSQHNSPVISGQTAQGDPTIGFGAPRIRRKKMQ